MGQNARNKRVILVIDEAQSLAPEVLEELRLFSNINAGSMMLLQTVLVGQLGLRDTLRRPDMRPLAQRIGVDYVLVPLDKEQTHEYIRHRLGVAGPGREGLFTADACDAIFMRQSRRPSRDQSLLRHRARLRLRRPETDDRRRHRERNAGRQDARRWLALSVVAAATLGIGHRHRIRRPPRIADVFRPGSPGFWTPDSRLPAFLSRARLPRSALPSARETSGATVLRSRPAPHEGTRRARNPSQQKQVVGARVLDSEFQFGSPASAAPRATLAGWPFELRKCDRRASHRASPPGMRTPLPARSQS